MAENDRYGARSVTALLVRPAARRLCPRHNVGPVPGGSTADRPAGLRQDATLPPDIHGGPLHAKPFGYLSDADRVAISHEKTVAKVLTGDQGCSDNQYMTQTKEIWFTTTRKGQRRAYYYSRRAFRAFPMPLAEAELLIATGAAVEIPCNPWPVS